MMNKSVKVVLSIGDICMAYGCLVVLTCAIGATAYKLGDIKARLRIAQILNEHLSNKDEQ